MDKKGITYLFVSIIVVLGTALSVLIPDRKLNDDEIVITVMNTGTIISVTTESVITTMSYTTTYTDLKYTVTSVTAVSSISTNSEPEKTSTEPVTTCYEEIYIDINTADIGELMKIDGIGEVTAAEIISYREQNGGFRNVEEIMNVYGIGEAKFEHIRNYVYVNNPVYDIEEEVTEEVTEPETVPEDTTEPELTLEDVAPVNINTAGIELLVLLPHVNEQIAQDIITLRSQLGGFQSIYELLYIDNLEQKQVGELEEFVTVGQ